MTETIRHNPLRANEYEAVLRESLSPLHGQTRYHGAVIFTTNQRPDAER